MTVTRTKIDEGLRDMEKHVRLELGRFGHTRKTGSAVIGSVPGLDNALDSRGIIGTPQGGITRTAWLLPNRYISLSITRTTQGYPDATY